MAKKTTKKKLAPKKSLRPKARNWKPKRGTFSAKRKK